MGHRERVAARDRAIQKGEEAYHAGLSIDANPYKVPTNRPRHLHGHPDGGWSLWPMWNVGWNNARHKAEQESRLTT